MQSFKLNLIMLSKSEFCTQSNQLSIVFVNFGNRDFGFSWSSSLSWVNKATLYSKNCQWYHSKFSDKMNFRSKSKSNVSVRLTVPFLFCLVICTRLPQPCPNQPLQNIQQQGQHYLKTFITMLINFSDCSSSQESW